ncbi:MAG: hypothetical protein A3H94_03650 [Acidobacteria bacterium RIFCSPLOWO2_02_FULL_60_20]|nr:MAG: hypothetical protein A3H94_03650 [Acidobacteria bacterium RIFCSPLOWO2_02_FULL_60_20]
MEIAVIGWGSLLWCPGSLLIKTRWNRDGPELQIEFARISSDGRLTLVLHPNPTATAQKTYWASSQFADIEQARENLRLREGRCGLKEIHACAIAEEGNRLHWSADEIPTEVKTKIGAWLSSKKEVVQAAVWTGLRTNWEEKRGRTFTTDDAVSYLTELRRHAADAKVVIDRAEEYLRNAPDQLQTEVRDRMRAVGWRDNPLPDILYEARPSNQGKST